MKGNVIRLNIMHLNSVHLNSIGEVQSVSLKAGESTEDPVYPPTTYTLAANVSNGKVTATKNGTAISLPYVATEGDVIVLSVTPDEGYEFNGWLDGNKSNPRTVTMTGNVVLSASCVEIAKPTYTLSASVTNGMVSAKRNGSAVNLPFTANEGDTIVLEVTPNDGYTFNGWNDGNTDNPRSITMNADVVLSAQCVEVVVPPVGKYIQFEDAEVERVLMSKGVSSDGVGITIEDAEKVTSIGTWFRDNGLIKSFLELSLFSNLKKIGGDTLGYSAFYSCDQLQSLGFPENVESIGAYCLYQCNNLSIDVSRLPQSIKSLGGFAFQGVTTTGVLDLPNLEGTINWTNFNDVAAKQLEGIENLGAVTSIAGFMKQEKLRYVNIPQTCNDIANNAFSGCIALEQVICRATTPPTLGTTVFSGSTCPIYVPDASLEAYKTAVNWSAYADRIHPLSEIERDDSRLDYIHDSMLMWLDGIDKGTIEGEWQDLVGGGSFVNHGAVAEADGWRFDGASSYMGSATLTNYGPGFGDRTFEIVAEFERENTTEVVYMGAGTGYAFGRYAAGKSILLGSDADLPSLADDMTSGVRIISVSTTAALQIVASKINGNNAQVGTKNYFVGGGDFIHLGKRSAGNHFKGIIHAIRIHDRILSEEEILYNQRIDNKRFNLGLDI